MDDVDGVRSAEPREETLEVIAVDDVDGGSCDELREEALDALDVDVLATNPIVVKGDGSPGMFKICVALRQLQTPQQYVVPPQGVSPRGARSVK